jgi:hypothetical protein
MRSRMGRILEVAHCTTLAESGARPIWQRHFRHTQLRRDESYNQKWHYVVENSMRAGLVKHACDWPYQGEMNELRWYS